MPFARQQSSQIFILLAKNEGPGSLSMRPIRRERERGKKISRFSGAKAMEEMSKKNEEKKKT